MIKIAAALIFLCAVAAPAFAGPYVALDYQKMKDMPTNELVTAACKAREINGGNTSQTITNLSAIQVSKALPETAENRAQCAGQIERMLRVLSSEGVTDKLFTL